MCIRLIWMDTADVAMLFGLKTIAAFMFCLIPEGSKHSMVHELWFLDHLRDRYFMLFITSRGPWELQILVIN